MALNDNADANYLTYIALNSIRQYNKKFRDQYGEMVICCDSSNSWRRDVFPYYKYRRRKNKQTSTFDWASFYKTFEEIKLNLKDVFGYISVKADKAEADDVIAILSRLPGKHVIVGNDKDFVQLKKEGKVELYAPLKKGAGAPSEVSPEALLKTFILKGDKDDGIPNVLSDDDTFAVDGKSQRPLTKKRSEALINLDWDTIESEELRKNIKRNETLIDLSKIPEEIEKAILANFNSQKRIIDASKISNYLTEKQFVSLYEKITDFR